MKLTYLTIILGLLFCYNPLKAQEGVKILKKSMLIDVRLGGDKKPIVKVTEVVEKLVYDPSKASTSDLKESIFYQDEFESNLKTTEM